MAHRDSCYEDVIPQVFADYPKQAVKSSLKVPIQAWIGSLLSKGPIKRIYCHLCNDFVQDLYKRKQ